MKAIRVHQFGGPEVLQWENGPPPPPPGPTQVLVRLHAAGVNPVETYIRSGAYAVLPSRPYTPGNDAAGVVEQVGADVKNVKPGRRVYTSGTVTGAYAELAVCEATKVHPLPDTISFAQGAGINTPYATASRALFGRARARAGETVLIHGASGGVGLAATQLARAAGMIVLGTGGTEPGRKLILENGAHAAFDHREPDYLSKMVKFTFGRGVDVILEMLANVNLGRDLTALAQRGRVVVIGSRGQVEINPRDAMLRDAEIHGLMLAHATDAELLEIHSRLGAGLENGTLRPVVGKQFPLAEAAAAHTAVMEPGACGKIILTM